MSSHQPLGSGGNGGIIAESGEPVDEGFLPEPGELALGVAARRLGNRLRGGGEGDGAFEVRAQLAISDEVEWLGVVWNAAAEKSGNLYDPAAVEHRVDALLDAIVQRGARRLQANLDGSVTFQAGSPGPVDFGKRAPGEQTDFDGTNHLRAIAGPNPYSGLGVQTPQDAMQILKTVLVRACLQACAQFLGACGGIRQPFQKRTQVEPCPDVKNRGPRAMGRVFEGRDGRDPIFSRRKSTA